MKKSNQDAREQLEKMLKILYKFEQKLKECQEPQRAILEVAITFLREEIVKISRTINE